MNTPHQHEDRRYMDVGGRLIEGSRVRAGLIGCGPHAFRNIAPTFRFTPIELVATCDREIARAEAFRSTFGARVAYADHHEMLEREDLDAVFVVTGLDADGRPQYPLLAVDCLEAGRHVWIEKPPASTTSEVDRIRDAAASAGRHVMVGFKKMFAPANEKAKALADRAEFGRITLLRLEYPQRLPTADEFDAYRLRREPLEPVVELLEHLCHPVSLLIYLAGMPTTLYYERAFNGSGTATFTHENGAVSSLAFTEGGASSDGLERTVIGSDSGRHVVVENNTRVEYHRLPFPGYGDVPDFYGADPNDTTAVWHPEFSLGQLYNKGLFLLGYYSEVNEFADAVLGDRPPRKGTIDDATCVTRIFEAFAQGSARQIDLTLPAPSDH